MDNGEGGLPLPFTLRGCGGGQFFHGETKKQRCEQPPAGRSTFADLTASTQGQLRAYFYQSERGLPGATIFYNTENFSSQRLWDRTFFVQGNMEHTFSREWVIQGNVKYNRGYLHYLDPLYLGAEGKYEDIFNQHEAYGSLALLYRAFDRLSFSGSSDLSSATMYANRKGFATPTRLTSRSVVPASG